MILNFDGLDWVYAGPIGPDEFGPGRIEGPAYRTSEGWRFATLAEWAPRPAWQDFTRPGFAVPGPSSTYQDHSVYRLASEYWNTFTHVDLNDANNGIIASGPGVSSSQEVPETWYVRNSSAVPEPGSVSLVVLGAGLAVLRLRRRS